MTTEESSELTRSGAIIAGKYRVERVLGEGGMGVVVAAIHEELDKRVALKFLLPSVAAREEYRQRFLREARAAVKIESEHVARVQDVGVHQGSPYMVMEYLEGSDLAEVVRERGPLSVPEAVGLLLEACEAIAEAHSLGIVHRDLKPANLFLARRPNRKPIVKVLDFGISKAPKTGGEADLTKTTGLMGSPLYMSPEQLVAAASVDVRSDVWALGVVLYEVLTRKVPFQADTMPELVGAILQRSPEPLGAVRADLPASLVAIVDRCLEKEPARRYPNVAELARALLPFGPPRSEQSVERIEHVLGQPTSGALPVQRSDFVLPPGAGTFTPAASGAHVPPPRRFAGVGVVAALGVVVAVGALFVMMRSRAMTLEAPASVPVSVASAVPAEPVALPPPTGASPMPLEPAVTPPEAASASASSSGAAPRNARPAPSTRPRPSAAPSASAPACHRVSTRDENGDLHFQMVCP